MTDDPIHYCEPTTQGFANICIRNERGFVVVDLMSADNVLVHTFKTEGRFDYSSFIRLNLGGKVTVTRD